jgi:hypothetical protein
MGTLRTLALVAGMFVVVPPVLAHHEWPVDQSRPITVTGRVTGVRWANPHVMIYLDVDAGGTVEKWTVGGSSPQFMTTCGWSKKTLHPGDVVTVIGYRFKDGSTAARMLTTTMANGQEMFYGAPPGHEAQCPDSRRVNP